MLTFKDKVRQGLRKLDSGSGTLRPTNIQKRLQDVTGLDVLTLKKGLQELRSLGEVESVSWDEYHGMPRSMMTLNLTPLPRPEHQAWWEDALESSSTPQETLKLLRKDNIVKNLLGLSREDMSAVISGLEDLRQSKKQGVSEFVGSARYLLASSKLLRAFGKAVKDDLTAPGDGFKSAPRYVIVAGPSEPTCVMLIENPQCFELAVKAGTADTIGLVSVYGYGLASASAHQEVEAFWGESFEKEDSSLVPLVRCGSPPSLERMLSADSIFWWGDLDLAGLDIFQRLKRRIPALRLSALYQPMIQILAEGGGHPYVKCVGKEKQPGRYALTQWPTHMKRIVEVCSERAVDQEAVSPELIVKLCSKKYSLA